MFCFERDMFGELDDLTITMETKFDVERVKEIIQQDGFVFLS